MKIRFLLDENLTLDVMKAVKRHESAIDILRIGMPGAPPRGTLDPEILRYCEVEGRVLVTDNRKSMPGHIADHCNAGHHHAGVLEVRPGASIGVLAYDLYMFWAASEAEEWIDRREYIPY